MSESKGSALRRRRGSPASGILAIACSVLGLAASCRAGSRLPVGELPRTAAGQCAAAFFEAFRSDGDEMLRAFLQERHSPAYLLEHPLDGRLARYNKLRGTWGRLTPVRVALDLELQLTLLVDADKTEDALVVRFQLGEEPPHWLSHISFSGIDHFDVPDEYAASVATRAAPVDDQLRDRTIEAVATSLRELYVYPDLGQRMADTLHRHQAQGLYRDLTTAGALAEKLTEDAVAVSNDLHIWVEAQNPMQQESTDPVNRDVAQLRRDTYDFKEARMLPGDIGYIRFDMIHDDEEAQEIVAAALADLAGSRVLVVDLRENAGGEWGTADLLLGYVLPAGTLLSRSYDRNGTLVEERAVRSAIPGVPFGADVPVYVLTSGRTGSAAEGLAYTLKHMGRAVVIGEVTRGAAHPSEEVVVNDYFRVSIPFRRSENVRTGTDWEGVGVIPQIAVPAEGALEAAVGDARQRIRNAR